jgi:hypothetical protein
MSSPHGGDPPNDDTTATLWWALEPKYREQLHIDVGCEMLKEFDAFR